MNINIAQKGDLLFEGINPLGAKHMIDGSAIHGLRPMEALLNSLASCAALDIVHILRKQKQDLESLDIEIIGTRPDEGQVKPFTHIEMIFHFTGRLDEPKVKRAVQLSVDKYCSVKNSLDPAIEINYSYNFKTL